MGVRNDIIVAILDTQRGFREIEKCRAGQATARGVAHKLDVPEDVVVEWLEELRSREIEKRMYELTKDVLVLARGDHPAQGVLPNVVRRCCTVPFEYRHDAEMLWVTLGLQLRHAEFEFDNARFVTAELASTRCEIVPSDAPRGDWPLLMAAEFGKYHAGQTPPVARVSSLRARALQAMSAEVVWKWASDCKDPERAGRLAECLPDLGCTIEQIERSVAALAERW